MKYSIIYADPPWTYEKSGGTTSARGLAKSFYPTMTPAELAKLDVGGLAADDSILFLWATFPKMALALSLIETWGFKYHNAAFVWVKRTVNDKDSVGMGFWSRANPEVCLLATRGKPKPASHSVRQLIYAPIDAHSKKPAVVRDKIVELAGDLPRIELFARETPPGWDVWGNEVDSDIELLA